MVARLIVGGLVALFVISLFLLGAAPGIGKSAEEATPLLASGDWLAPRLGSPHLLIIDTRSSGLYLEGHIPGAQVVSADNLRSMSNGVPSEIFLPEVLSVVFGRFGLTLDSQVVIYSNRVDPEATFVAGLLRSLGLSRVTLLEGGFERWKAENRPITKDRPRVAATRPQLSVVEPMFVGLEEVKKASQTKDSVIIDARGEESFMTGHIPGAVVRPQAKDFVPPGQRGEGNPRPVEELAAEYKALGVVPGKPVIVYCGTGFTASSVYYTLRHRMGIQDVRIYDGSWLEWSSLPNPAIEKLEAPAPLPNQKVVSHGLDIHYRIIGQGPPLLILGGGPGDVADRYLSLCELLSKKVKCILVEQRGTGKSAPAVLDASTISVALTLDDFEAIRKQLGLEQWSVLGFSYGGYLASLYAHFFPSSISSLILLGSMGQNWDGSPAFMDNVNSRLAASDRELVEFWSDPKRMKEDPQKAITETIRARMPGYFYDRKKSLLVSQAVKPSDFNFDTGDLIDQDSLEKKLDLARMEPNFDRPVLILHGIQDPSGEAVPLALARYYKNSHLKWIEKSGYYSWIEQPDKIFQAITQFLAANPQGNG